MTFQASPQDAPSRHLTLNKCLGKVRSLVLRGNILRNCQHWLVPPSSRRHSQQKTPNRPPTAHKTAATTMATTMASCPGPLRVKVVHAKSLNWFSAARCQLSAGVRWLGLLFSCPFNRDLASVSQGPPPSALSVRSLSSVPFWPGPNGIALPLPLTVAFAHTHSHWH